MTVALALDPTDSGASFAVTGTGSGGMEHRLGPSWCGMVGYSRLMEADERHARPPAHPSHRS